MTAVVRWEDPPDQIARGKRVIDWASIAEELRQHPGRWAVVSEAPANVGIGWFIKTGRYAWCRPAGSFQSASRRVAGVLTIYARYVGDGGQP